MGLVVVIVGFLFDCLTHPGVRSHFSRRSNPLKLGIPNDGTLETIQQQLTRGDKHHGARQKCWDHIILELSSCGVEVREAARPEVSETEGAKRPRTPT